MVILSSFPKLLPLRLDVHLMTNAHFNKHAFREVVSILVLSTTHAVLRPHAQRPIIEQFVPVLQEQLAILTKDVKLVRL